jgi:2-oxoglutarate ferredoxin oxidoreductase subunit alpha
VPIIETDLAIAITGSGGSGVVTTGSIFLDAIARAGGYGLLTRSAGPQIRGGESAVMMRLSDHPVTSMGDHFHLLVALDWGNFERFKDELVLTEQTWIFADPALGQLPTCIASYHEHVYWLDLQQYSASIAGGRPNMVALGALAAAINLPHEAVNQAAITALQSKGESTVTAALACIDYGYHAPQRYQLRQATFTTDRDQSTTKRLILSGNEAAGFGALRGGIRFVAAYPITPATELLEWLAPRLERLGGILLQAEDELASINMIIGSSFGGVPSLTATSGPGFSLMLEGIGLAITSETPIVVVNVMRGGPSTGIPTKTEQSDLNTALYGPHGDAPHIVLAPLTIADTITTVTWGVTLAETLQTAVIVLSDQSLGQSRTIIDCPPPAVQPSTTRLKADLQHMSEDEHYHRYRLTASNISPISHPGERHGHYTADGLEHNESGTPSSSAQHHSTQLDKRRNKLLQYDFGTQWAHIEGQGTLCLITWGSSYGAVAEAGQRLRQQGQPVLVLGLRLLSPLKTQALRLAIAEATTIWVIELNHSGQLFHYLHAEQALPTTAQSLARPGPLPWRPQEIIAAITQHHS